MTGGFCSVSAFGGIRPLPVLLSTLLQEEDFDRRCIAALGKPCLFSESTIRLVGSGGNIRAVLLLVHQGF